MTHKITEQLRTLLKAYAERAAKVHADAKPVVDEGGQRRRACGERLQKVVRPALLRFLTELENAGHDASVQDHTDSVDTYPSVALSFTPRASGARALASLLTFRYDPRRGIAVQREIKVPTTDRKSTRLNSSHSQISYAVFCLKKKKQ